MNGIPLVSVVSNDWKHIHEVEYVTFNELIFSRAPFTGHYYLMEIHIMSTIFLPVICIASLQRVEFITLHVARMVDVT